jgi:protocatechuate 3,4-dioxygenase beta subunit
VVEGKVVASVGGAPLRKVELKLSTSDVPEGMEGMEAMFGGGEPTAAPDQPSAKTKTVSATTDEGGKFRFDQVEPGDYFLSAKRAGYVDGQYKPEGKYAVDGKLRLRAGDSLTDVEFRLVPLGAIGGRVLEEDGDPVSGAIVVAQSYYYGGGRRRLQPADSGQTTDRGEFRLGKLKPGRYYLSVSPSNGNPLAETPPPPKDGSPETGYVSTYYPSVTDIGQATAITVAAGADLSGFAIQLRKSRVVRIKGKAVDADGKPIGNAMVMLMSPANPGGMLMRMLGNPEGRFEIAGVEPGSYMIMTTQMSGSSPSIHMQPLVVPAEGLDNVQLGAQPEGTVQGNIMVAGDDKVALKGLRVMLAGGEDAPSMPAFATASESGDFVVKKLAAAPYNLTLPHLPDGTYLKSVQLGGHERLGQTLDFSAGFAAPVQIVLGTDGGEFEATVSRDDKPVADATVVLLAADPNGRFPETTRTGESDSAGHVKIKDVPPGDYIAFAWEEVEEGEWLDAGFLKPFDNQATRVRIQPKGHEKAQLAAIPAAK